MRLAVTFSDAVGGDKQTAEVQHLLWMLLICVKQIDLFPTQVHEQFTAVRAVGQIGGCQGAILVTVVTLLLGQVT